jgi:hypothetical protein
MPATAGLRGKRKVHYLVPPTPVALVFWNHRVAGNLVVAIQLAHNWEFLLWSFILRDLYRSLPE